MGTAIEAAPSLADLAVEPVVDADALGDDERRAEAWALVCRGWSKTAIGERYGVSRQAVAKWLRKEAQRRRSLVATIDEEAERLVGQLEAVVAEAWAAHRALGDGSKAVVGPQYLRLVRDAVGDIARLRGIERPGDAAGARRQVEVVVKIGGSDGPAVGVRAS